MRAASALHRDISVRNTLIHPDGVKGFLHDFDQMTGCDENGMAIINPIKSSEDTRIRVAVGYSLGYCAEAYSQFPKGTPKFMASEALDPPTGSRHTLVHDLKSIFWLILWVSIDWQGPGATGALRLDRS